MRIFIILFGFFLHMNASAQLCIEGDCINKNGTMINTDGSSSNNSGICVTSSLTAIQELLLGLCVPCILFTLLQLFLLP